MSLPPLIFGNRQRSSQGKIKVKAIAVISGAWRLMGHVGVDLFPIQFLEAEEMCSCILLLSSPFCLIT
jgi:hypothetical protein